jgi:hypothetical protein
MSMGKGVFECALCGFQSPFDEFATTPTFSPNICYKEPCFVIRDPFSQGSLPLALGSICAKCQAQVCLHPKCSAFVGERLCLSCLRKNREEEGGGEG